MAVYTFDQMKRLVQRLVRAEMARDTLAFDYQLLQDDARTRVAEMEQQRDEYAEGYARQRDKVEKLEQQLSDADVRIDKLLKLSDLLRKPAARRFMKITELENALKANEGIIEMQAKRLATARVQFDSISKAAGACADAVDLDP